MKGTKQIRGVILGAAVLGAIASAPVVAHAQNGGMDVATAAAPTAITGSVVRYYVDRAGYVTAADIQTSTGISLVRFSSYWGQRLYSAYPVGSQASLYVAGSDMSGWRVVGIGTTAPTTWAAHNDIDSLDSEAFIMPGTEPKTYSGSLRRIITNARGEVIGLILSGGTLVRVPREVRNIAPGDNGSERKVSLFKGAKIEARGYQEAPRYGVISAFPNRVAATALIVNGKSAGAIGFPTFSVKEKASALFNGVDIGGASATAEEARALGQGYTLYTPNSADSMLDNDGS